MNTAQHLLKQLQTEGEESSVLNAIRKKMPGATLDEIVSALLEIISETKVSDPAEFYSDVVASAHPSPSDCDSSEFVSDDVSSEPPPSDSFRNRLIQFLEEEEEEEEEEDTDGERDDDNLLRRTMSSAVPL
jgi:hypothetical protein